MQTCPECGTRNEDGELFCGSCGNYLEWEEQQAAAAEEQAAAEQVAPAEDFPAPGGVADDDGAGPAVPAEDVTVEGVPVADVPAGADAPVAAHPTGTGPTAPVDVAPPDSARDEQVPAAGPPDASGTSDAPEDAGEESTPAAGGRAGGRGSDAFGKALRGGSGGRAASMLRRAADQATGGAASQVSSTASRTTSRARSARSAPGRTAGSELGRAASGVVPPAAGAAVHRAGTTPAAARPAPAKPRKPAPRRPEARKPGAPVPRRQVPATDVEEPPPSPGDLICGACGAGNAPHRNFCRRCGASLADAPVQPQRSWWQRLLRPDRRPGPQAGARPRRRRNFRFPTRLVVVLVVLGLIGGAGWVWREPIGSFAQLTVDRVAGKNPHNPDAIEASSSWEGHPADALRDGDSTTGWAPAEAGQDARSATVTFTFAEPFRFAYVLITAGAGPTEKERLTAGQPSKLRLVMTTPDGTVDKDLELEDTGAPQQFTVGVDDVEEVQLIILEASGATQQQMVVISEVEFAGR